MKPENFEKTLERLESYVRNIGLANSVLVTHRPKKEVAVLIMLESYSNQVKRVLPQRYNNYEVEYVFLPEVKPVVASHLN